MTPGADEVAERLAAARDTAMRALQPSWAEKSSPRERFSIEFRAGWDGCGRAMSAIDAFDVDDIEWKHDLPYHSVTFSCTFSTLKSVQLAVRGAPVLEPRCRRMRQEGGAE